MTATHPSVADARPDLTIPDLTDSTQGCHALQLIVAQLNEALTAAWGCPSRIWRGDPIVSLADNYDRLGYPPDAITRDRRYTRYVDADHVLRSHTSALVPGALRHLAAEVGSNRLVIGTDHPIPWHPNPVDHIMNTSGFTDEERIAMLGGTAGKLLGIQ